MCAYIVGIVDVIYSLGIRLLWFRKRPDYSVDGQLLGKSDVKTGIRVRIHGKKKYSLRCEDWNRCPFSSHRRTRKQFSVMTLLASLLEADSFTRRTRKVALGRPSITTGDNETEDPPIEGTKVCHI